MEDVTGLPLTCSSREAVNKFNKGLMAYVTLKESPVRWFEEAVECDRNLVLAHCMLVRGWLVIQNLADNVNFQGFFLLYDFKPPTDPKGSYTIAS